MPRPIESGSTARRAPARPPSLTTGNNPRGVAIKAPVAPPTPVQHAAVTLGKAKQVQLAAREPAPKPIQQAMELLGAAKAKQLTPPKQAPGHYTDSGKLIHAAGRGIWQGGPAVGHIAPPKPMSDKAALAAAKADIEATGRKFYVAPKHKEDLGLSFGSIFNPVTSSVVHAIESPALAVAKAAGHGAGAAAHAVGGFGSGLLQGGEALGVAAFHDATHPSTWNAAENNLGPLRHNTSALSQVAQGMAKSDPLAALIVNQDPAEAVRAAKRSPANAALDLLGGYGAVGRGLGVASDLAKAREAGGILPARAARLARDSQTLHAGVTEPRQFSTNLLTARAQAAADEGRLGELGQRLTTRNTEKLLAKRATEHHASTIAVETRTAIRAEKAGRKAGLKGDQLRKHVAAAQNAVTAELHSRAINENAIGGRGYKSVRAARGARTRIGNALGIDPHTFTVVKSVTKKGDAPHNWLSRVVNDYEKGSEAHEYKLIPSSFSDRLTQHYTKQGENLELTLPGGHKLSMASFTRQFRNTVLPFSTKWFTGNVVEGGLRNGLRGILPTDPILAHRALQEMENQGHSIESDVLRGHAMGGLNYGMQERLSNEVRDAKGGKSTLAGRAVEGYNRNIPERIFIKNRQAEQGIASATLGRYMRMHMHNVGETASPENIAREFAKPEVARAAGRYVRHVLGKYDAFKPGYEKFIRNSAPFAPWYMNAAKFIGHDLPVERPLTTAGLLAAHNATGAAWAKAHASNNPDLESYFGGIPAGDLNYDIKTGKSKFEDIARFTPFGAFTDNPINVALQTLVPELQSPARAYLGEDPFGSDLMAPGPASKYTPTGKLSKATKHRIYAQSGAAQATALSSLLSEILGPADAAHRILVDKGATPYNTEKLWQLNPKMKPGTQRGPRNPLSGLNRVWNPFFPIVTRPKPKAAGAAGPAGALGGSSSGGSSGGNFL